MADILATWLNEEVGLSKKILNFEQDFASGYLLGELLYKFNQQSDFELFSNKDINTHRVRNFEKLEPTLRNLSIKFDSMTCDKIMKGERGYALRLLYQLKMTLEKVYPPTDIVVLTKTGKFGDNQPAQKISQTIEKYDKIQHEFFKHRLAALNKPQKQINMDEHLKKFVREQERQAKLAADGLEAEKQAQNVRKQDLRRIQINKLQRNAGFMEEWQAKGVDDWKRNQKKKKEREMQELEFDYKQAQKYNNTAMNKLNNAHAEVYQGISKFEEAHGIETESNVDEMEAQEVKKMSQTEQGQGKRQSPFKSMGRGSLQNSLEQKGLKTATGAFTLDSTGLKQRTKKTMTEADRAARAKRRRRLIANQEEHMVELEQKNREDMVVELMKRQAAQEKELEYEVWRTMQCKNVIIENRNLRENQYKRRKELDREIAEQKEIQILSSEKDQTYRLVDEKLHREVEMRGYEQDAKLKAHTELCAALLDRIIDIADEAYKHQQKIDSKDIDPRNWHEWMQLFINEKPIANTHDKLARLVTEETAGTDSTKLEAEEDEANQKLDELEMIDYITNQGQWKKELVANNKPNFEQIINPPVKQNPAELGKKAAPARTAVVQEPIFDSEDLEVKDQPDNNFLLGDAIETIIKLNYADRPPLKHPKTPSWLPLKICLVGIPFSGKKEQAKLLHQKFGLDIFVMEDLINEAIAFKNKDSGIDESPKHDSRSQISGFSGFEGEIENFEDGADFDKYEDFKQCGEQIENLLLAGEEITDELYVKLFVTKLRIQYECKDAETLKREIMKDAKTKISKKNHDEVGFKKEQGWVLVDFPCTYAQAKLLEKALSGYEPEEDLEFTNRQKLINDATLLVQPNPKPKPPQTLIKSGLDAVIWFDCEVQESLRRADGRRVNRQTMNQIYHVEDNVPPMDQAPLCEHLRPVKDDSEHTGSLIDRFLSFEQASHSLKTWLTQFGVEDEKRNLMHVINASQRMPDVHDDIASIINSVMSQKKEKYAKVLEPFISHLIQAKEAKHQKQLEEEKALRDAEQSRSQLLDTKQSHPSQLTHQIADPSEKKLVEAPPSKTTTAVIEPTPLTPEQIRERIDNDFKPVIIELWTQLSTNYKKQMKKIFKNFRLMREQVLTRRSDIQQRFLGFLHNVDGKQAILDEFVNKFNQFSDDFPDLREDDQTKEELHQRTDVLSDELWEIVEERKEASIELRKQIMDSGTCEYSLQFITNVAQQLMQAELDKFKVSIQILQDYYHAIEDKLIPEAAPSATVELGFDDGDQPPIETLLDGSDPNNADQYTYPKLDRLLMMALKQQVIADVTEKALTTDPKKAPPKGKGPPPKTAEVEENKRIEESVYAKELKEAIKVEKGIFRYRLVQIRNWSLKNLKDTRREFLVMYKKLEDWIYVAQKAEMEAIEQMCILIKQHIESEQKIKAELRLKFMDFTVDRKTLNFITPPPPLLPAMEDRRNDRFAIVQLDYMREEFELMESSLMTRDKFRDKCVIDMFVSKRNASVGFQGLLSALPKDWNNYGQQEIRHMIINLDFERTGFIHWRTMFTYITLLKSAIPTNEQVAQLKGSCGATKEGQVSFDTFMKAKFWFDKSEASIDKPGAHVFPRVKMIKELLFKTHSKMVAGFNEPMVDINNLCEIFKIPIIQHPRANFANYHEFLFAPINKSHN